MGLLEYEDKDDWKGFEDSNIGARRESNSQPYRRRTYDQRIQILTNRSHCTVPIAYDGIAEGKTNEEVEVITRLTWATSTEQHGDHQYTLRSTI